MERRYGFSEGFPEGKSEGWNGRPKPAPQGGQIDKSENSISKFDC